jgi:hypothetical protein
MRCAKPASQQRACRECGCTENDCSGCIARTGAPCHWIEADLCSACADPQAGLAPLAAIAVERQRQIVEEGFDAASEEA